MFAGWHAWNYHEKCSKGALKFLKGLVAVKIWQAHFPAVELLHEEVFKSEFFREIHHVPVFFGVQGPGYLRMLHGLVLG